MADRFNDEIKKALSWVDFEGASKNINKFWEECYGYIPRTKDSNRDFIEAVIEILLGLSIFLYLGLCFICFVYLLIGPIVALGTLLLFFWF